MQQLIWSLKDGQKGPGAAVVSCANPVLFTRVAGIARIDLPRSIKTRSVNFSPCHCLMTTPHRVRLADTEVARLPNHAIEAVNESRLNKYYDNAIEIAEWAIATRGALPFACDDAVQCSTDFINNFAYVAYRRA